MKFKNLQELIDGLTAEEREQFKDLIQESKDRDASIQENRKSSLDNLEKIKANMALLSGEYRNMVVQFDELSKALVELSKSLDKLNKVKEKPVLMYPREYHE